MIAILAVSIAVILLPFALVAWAIVSDPYREDRRRARRHGAFE